MDKILILTKYTALMVFYNRDPVVLTSDRDIRELIYFMLDIHRNLINDDITQKIDISELEEAS